MTHRTVPPEALAGPGRIAGASDRFQPGNPSQVTRNGGVRPSEVTP